MRIGTTISSRGQGGAAVALAGLAALTAACASGGGAPPPAGTEAEALFVGLTGSWVVDEDVLVYMPTPGRTVELPMSGEWIWQDPERRFVRARVFRDGEGLTLERRVGSLGRVRSVLEIVDGRLQISRTNTGPAHVRTRFPVCADVRSGRYLIINRALAQCM